MIKLTQNVYCFLLPESIMGAGSTSRVHREGAP